MSQMLIQRGTMVNIANAIRAKTGTQNAIPVKNLALEILKMHNAGNLGPLYVRENGEYGPGYTAATVQWGENTEYDFTVTMEGINLRCKKMPTLCVPENARYFSDPNYAMTLRQADGAEECIPLMNLGMEPIDAAESGYWSEGLMYAVIWVRNAEVFNAMVGDTVFENDSVYVSNFFWTIQADAFAGATFSLTAPGERLDGISSVSADVQPVLQTKQVWENGVVTFDEGYDGLGEVYVEVPAPEGYIQPIGTKTITENGQHDVTEYASVNVAIAENEPLLQEKTATRNGTVTADDGYDGLRKVTVAVPKPSGTLSITKNGTHDVADYGNVEVAVPSGGGITFFGVKPNIRIGVNIPVGSIAASMTVDLNDISDMSVTKGE